MKPNQKVVVLPSAPYHAGKIAYFQFSGEAHAKGTIVLATEPKKTPYGSQTYFAVDEKHIKVVMV